MGKEMNRHLRQGRWIRAHRLKVWVLSLLLVLASAVAAPAANELYLRFRLPRDTAQYRYYSGLFYGLATDSQGNVYATDNLGLIWKFDASGNLLLTWGSSGSGDGQFNFPAALAVDSQGNVLVVDFGNNRIQKFDSTGKFLLK